MFAKSSDHSFNVSNSKFSAEGVICRLQIAGCRLQVAGAGAGFRLQVAGQI